MVIVADKGPARMLVRVGFGQLPDRMNRTHADDILEAFDRSHNVASMRPRTGVGNEQMIPSRGRWKCRPFLDPIATRRRSSDEFTFAA
mmetsp:Transcript_956/g.1099  ORF Transcript_956/g.1099 Transcript_956/m.1099 type:complete len:88 (+) Transcript_956:879-1142(+)